MTFDKFSSIDIEGFLFDGTFESSVNIATYLREKGQLRVSRFTIEHFNSGSRLGQTNLSFIVMPWKHDPNDKGATYVLFVGDLLRVQPNNFEVIKKDVLARFWRKSDG